MGVVSTIPEKCRRCYTCIRECPAKAIKVGKSGEAMVIAERCIACGNCVKVCAQNAKLIEDDAAEVLDMLKGSAPVFACLAPSFPAAFAPVRPGRIVAGLKRMGFFQVWEVAFGAEIVSREYVALFRKAQQNGACVISTPCPAIVAYVEKFMPSLHNALAPIVSPMIAVARAIRRRHGSNARVVFIGPCIAKKEEAHDAAVAKDVDAVLTFKELLDMFAGAGLCLDALAEAGFDSPPTHLGGSYPISGGLLKTAGLSADILENDVIVTEGKDRALDALRELDAGKGRERLLDVLFCEGCINGPKMLSDLSVYARKEIVAEFVKQKGRTSPEALQQALAEFEGVNLGRTFTRQNLVLPRPSEAEIDRALAAMKKRDPKDQLNCGACGYASCLEKAVAVCQGLAEAEMCLPYLIDELQGTCRMLELSHEELASAQQRLVQSERLASMGQLSAGVAHEINNPLGTVLIYSHMLLKQLEENHPIRSDIQMIVKEATRCKNIVRGLLDFARQSRVTKSPTAIAGIVDDVAAIMARKAEAAGVRLTRTVPDDLPLCMLDGDQIKQTLLNLVENALDATRAGGQVRIEAALAATGKTLAIRIIDNGCGIPPENLPKLFDPFFTTKEMGKGTGLGLAIAYGVVKMHSGDITVESEAGKGTTFTVSLPIGGD